MNVNDLHTPAANHNSPDSRNGGRSRRLGGGNTHESTAHRQRSGCGAGYRLDEFPAIPHRLLFFRRAVSTARTRSGNSRSLTLCPCPGRQPVFSRADWHRPWLAGSVLPLKEAVITRVRHHGCRGGTANQL